MAPLKYEPFKRKLKRLAGKISLERTPKNVNDSIILIMVHSENDVWNEGKTYLHKILFLLQKWANFPSDAHIIDNFGPVDVTTEKSLKTLGRSKLIKSGNLYPYRKTLKLTRMGRDYFRNNFGELNPEMRDFVQYAINMSRQTEDALNTIIDICYGEIFGQKTNVSTRCVSWKLFHEPSIVHTTLAHNLIRYFHEKFKREDCYPCKSNYKITPEELKPIRYVESETTLEQEFRLKSSSNISVAEDFKTFNSYIPIYLEGMNSLISIFHKAPTKEDIESICLRKGYHDTKVKEIKNTIKNLKREEDLSSSKDHSYRISILESEKRKHIKSLEMFPLIINQAFKIMEKKELVEIKEGKYYLPMRRYISGKTSDAEKIENSFGLIDSKIYLSIINSEAFQERFPVLKNKKISPIYIIGPKNAAPFKASG